MSKPIQLIYLILFCSCIVSCKKTSTPSESKVQQTAIYYLYNKSLLSDSFSHILWKAPVDFRGLDVEKNELYFIFPKELGKQKMLAHMVLDTTKVEFAPCETGECNFGGLSGNIDGYYAFRTPTTNLKVDTSIVFHCNLKHESLSFSFNELQGELDSTIYYNSAKYFNISGFIERKAAANIGSYISKRGRDPILIKLVEQITKGLTRNEDKAQKLLDFVTTNIDYSYEDFWYESEITKRAHEVLFSGEADCSGKSTLYASLLEQANIPYALLYYNKHVNVGVEANFANQNTYVAKVKGKTYFKAETTTPQFVIGTSRLKNPEILEHVLFYQIPALSDSIYNFQNNKALTFINHIEEE